MFNSVIFLSSLIAAVSTSVLSNSECPDMKPIENFNLSGVANGIWYEIARYPYDVETAESCVTFNTRSLGDGFVAESINVPSNSPELIRAECRRVISEENTGLLNFTISSGGHPSKLIHLPVVQIILEHDGYLLSYSCKYDEIKNIKQDFAWIFSRKQIVSDEDTEDVHKIIKSIGYFDINKFIWIDHSKCNAEL